MYWRQCAAFGWYIKKLNDKKKKSEAKVITIIVKSQIKYANKIKMTTRRTIVSSFFSPNHGPYRKLHFGVNEMEVHCNCNKTFPQQSRIFIKISLTPLSRPLPNAYPLSTAKFPATCSWTFQKKEKKLNAARKAIIHGAPSQRAPC